MSVGGSLMCPCMHIVVQSTVHVAMIWWEPVLANNKPREGLSKYNIILEAILEAILQGVHRSVCQVSDQVSVIFKCTDLCKLTIACVLPGNIA